MVRSYYEYIYCKQYTPSSSHLRGGISSACAHLLNTGLAKFLCLFITWLKNDENLAQITSPLPVCVVLALQYKWFVHGLIHSAMISLPLTFASFVKTLFTSEM